MERLSEQIIQQVAALPEGTPLTAKGLLHLGSRAAVDQALLRLTERGQLIRAGPGLAFNCVLSKRGLGREALRLSKRLRLWLSNVGRSLCPTVPPLRMRLD